MLDKCVWQTFTSLAVGQNVDGNVYVLPKKLLETFKQVEPLHICPAKELFHLIDRGFPLVLIFNQFIMYFKSFQYVNFWNGRHAITLQ